jgi:hypothetical protein
MTSRQIALPPEKNKRDISNSPLNRIARRIWSKRTCQTNRAIRSPSISVKGQCVDYRAVTELKLQISLR